MPFDPECLKELRNRENLSQYRLAVELPSFAQGLGLEHLLKSCTPQTIYNWEKGNTVPSINTVDILYLYASSKGHNDIKFYEPPLQKLRWDRTNS